MKHNKHEFASTCWTANDVHDKRESMGLCQWTDEQAEDWLEKNQRQIVDDMVERGWDSIECLLSVVDGEGN
jgi:hypothetical protein